MSAIEGSVGRDGSNSHADVKTVQKLLRSKGFNVGHPDGVCGSRTVTAIETFQHGFLRRPDGRVDPDGKTWTHLASATPAPVTKNDTLTRKLPRPDLTTINAGLTFVDNAYMVSAFGHPRVEQDYEANGQSLTNPRLKRNAVTLSVGPFRVTGLRPAVMSLQTILQEVCALQPEVYAGLGTRGMLNVRWVRGSTTAISNHSFGTAIDLTINGDLDKRGDDLVQYGLMLIAPIFNRHRWFWGAGFRTEDAMHFEASRGLVESWRSSIV
ncbi:MAG: hypothetical protein RL701_4877 [Pseudomonadota bacterium]|jgi:hypothetical protein